MLDLNKLEKRLDDTLSQELDDWNWMDMNCEEIIISKFQPKETLVTAAYHNKKMYMVKYSKGAYEDFEEITIFVTNSKEKADAYAVRFNTLLDELIYHYKKMYKFNDDDIYESDYYGTKLCKVMDINSCFVEEVEFRP